MKKIFTFLVIVLFTASTFAQSPEKMSYQAVIRNTAGNLVTNQSVGIQISILQGSVDGTAVYTETQTPTTNANGLVSVEIGSETGFDAIDWANGPYFIKTETDPSGGASYSITGTSQLMSVPYALHAKTADSIADFSITGNESSFANWDKNVTDDFTGEYDSLIGAPVNVSAFTNDVGYITNDSIS